ncbi:Gfo/Idh/MocA family oxidoreductase [Neobacillus cucumis]|uniref:Gfo/Idh/MocA family protein n=1 Tax=Neobacillus cucumis TaxID=1740721 RepID=UPI002E1B8147|nr:Gfo/Idh/MocA family oxidoreductase [Neobacillus cucumis]
MKKLKVGIVGCGRISVIYKDAFRRCSDLIEVKYAVDKVLKRAEEFAGDFGCGFSDSYDDILVQDLDVIHICTPHFLHKEQVIKALQKGINVLTEKPLAINLEDADSIIKAAEASGKKFGVIFQNRYIEGVKEAKKIIEKGDLGNIIGAWSHLTWWRPPSYYECDWKGSWEKEGGGVLIDQAIHSIDLVQYLVGSPVEWIHGHIDNRILKTVEVEDVADAVIKFNNGCLYSLFACNYYTSNAPIQIEIMGEKGKVNIKGFDVTIETDSNKYEIPATSMTDVSFSGQGYWGIYHYEQIIEFYNNVINNSSVPIDGAEGRKALEIVLGVYQSSREGQKIFL